MVRTTTFEQKRQQQEKKTNAAVVDGMKTTGKQLVDVPDFHIGWNKVVKSLHCITWTFDQLEILHTIKLRFSNCIPFQDCLVDPTGEFGTFVNESSVYLYEIRSGIQLFESVFRCVNSSYPNDWKGFF